MVEYCSEGSLADAVHTGLLHGRPAAPAGGSPGPPAPPGALAPGAGGRWGSDGGGSGADPAGAEGPNPASLDVQSALCLLLDVARGMTYLHARCGGRELGMLVVAV